MDHHYHRCPGHNNTGDRIWTASDLRSRAFGAGVPPIHVEERHVDRPRCQAVYRVSLGLASCDVALDSLNGIFEHGDCSDARLATIVNMALRCCEDEWKRIPTPRSEEFRAMLILC